MISVVMSYYNRLQQLNNTLATLSDSVVTDFEVIIVDDFSAPDQQPDSLLTMYSNLNIEIIKMATVVECKTYCNPCVPYNVGFRQSRGDKIIIQNPECCHVGDLLSFVDSRLTDDNYLTFHCYAAGIRDDVVIKNNIDAHTLVTVNTDSLTGRWYNHEVHRPVALHFTNAITRSNLSCLNGFDERFAYGEWFDDNELLHRVKKHGLRVDFVANPYVIHQWHTKDSRPSEERIQTNRELMHAVISEGITRAPNSKNI